MTYTVLLLIIFRKSLFCFRTIKVFKQLVFRRQNREWSVQKAGTATLPSPVLSYRAGWGGGYWELKLSLPKSDPRRDQGWLFGDSLKGLVSDSGGCTQEKPGPTIGQGTTVGACSRRGQRHCKSIFPCAFSGDRTLPARSPGAGVASTTTVEPAEVGAR